MKNQSDSQHESVANLNSEKFKLRCPSCAKLYEVDSVDIETVSPQFQCVSCDCRFTFAYPPINPDHIVCSVVNALGHLSLQTEQKTCPKCAAISPAEAEECYSCRVIFARLEGLPADSTLRAQPSLVRKWKMLMEDFTDETKHEEFVSSCQQVEALSFAFSKYNDMKQALGGDALCERMLLRVQKLSEVSGQTAVKENSLAKKSGRSRPWTGYIVPGAYIMCALLILWGSFSLANRNLVGVGVAIACLMTGVILSGKGRVNT